MKQLLQPGVVQIVQVANRHGISKRTPHPWTGLDFQSNFTHEPIAPNTFDTLESSTTVGPHSIIWQYGFVVGPAGIPEYETASQYLDDLCNAVNDDVRIGNINGTTGGVLFNKYVRNSALTLKTVI